MAAPSRLCDPTPMLDRPGGHWACRPNANQTLDENSQIQAPSVSAQMGLTYWTGVGIDGRMVTDVSSLHLMQELRTA